jgi:hypothetical protein
MAAVDQRDIYDSMTMQSDSETYDQPDMSSPSSPSSDSASPLILYSPPTFWGLVRGAAINLLLPFVNGLMLGFGELFANELAFRFGWSNTKVCLAASIKIGTETDPGAGVSQPQTSRTRRRDVNRSCRKEETQRSGVGRLHELGVGWDGESRETHMIYAGICLRFAWQHGAESALVGHFVFLVTLMSRLTKFVLRVFAIKHVNIYPNRHTSSLHICLAI